MISIEGATRFYTAGIASVVEEERELAWAQPHISRQPDLKWILGNFVQAETPNSNGHIVTTADLKDAMKTIPHKPLNINHQAGRRVGTYTAAEMVYPTGESAADSVAEPPIVEALAAFWHYYEPEIWPAVQMAHADGHLFFSMETVPKEITCKGKGDYAGCDATFEYAGRTSPTYCDHLNEVASRKVLHRPQYTAGALIIPPVKPGWKQANVKEISKLVEEQAEQSERVYAEIAAETPHNDPRTVERIMAFLMNVAKG
jgi:hypothetical protein